MKQQPPYRPCASFSELNEKVVGCRLCPRLVHFREEVPPKGDFRDEVETFFGSGTQTQEMYITPSLLSSADWNALAKGARWSLENAETL